MFYGKNKNESKTQMVQQLEVICAMIPVHICHYDPESGFQKSKKQQQTISKYAGNDMWNMAIVKEKEVAYWNSLFKWLLFFLLLQMKWIRDELNQSSVGSKT